MLMAAGVRSDETMFTGHRGAEQESGAASRLALRRTPSLADKCNRAPLSVEMIRL